MEDFDLKSVFSNSTEFETIAKTFTVKDIMNPLDYFDMTNFEKSYIQESIEFEMHESGLESRFVILLDKGKVIGVKDSYFNCGDIYEELLEEYGDHESIPFKELHNIDDIFINKVISSDLGLIDLFPLLIKEDYLLVLEKNTLAGYLTFSDIDRMPVKLSLFALLLEFEANITKKLRKIDNLDAYLVLLSKTSINKIKRMAKNEKRRRNDSGIEEVEFNPETGKMEKVDENKISSYEAVQYLNIEEKQFLLREYLSREHPLTDEGIALMDNVFGLIKRVRNLIAHGESILQEIEDPSHLELLLAALLKWNELYKTL